MSDVPGYYRWKYFSDSYSPEDFVHGNAGPWPQPAPDNPLGQLAQVLHIPQSEYADWKKNTSNVYRCLFLTQWPCGLLYALRTRHFAFIDDASFDAYLTDGLYSRFLSPLDAGDVETFSRFLGDRPDACMKCDLTCMEAIANDTYAGMYAAASVALICPREEGGHKVAAIYLPTQGLLLERGAGDEWTLAKYFVLQGAAHRINLITHARLHFPFDPINAVTKSIIPKRHWLMQLLAPHFRLSLAVNHSVLEGKYSLISRTAWTLWAPFVAPGKIVRRLFPYAYVGLPDNNSYPAYSFPRQPECPPTAYGRFLRRYYDTVREFVDNVVKHIFATQRMPGSKDWELIALWAEHCAQWVPGFPGPDQINDQECLIDTLALIIWDLSISHSTDHDAIHTIANNELIFRLRVPPPGDEHYAGFDRTRLNSWFDLFKTWFTDKLFYEPHNVALLKDVDYGFCDHTLREFNRVFVEQLRATEAQMKADGMTLFAPLEHIATSIQY